MTTGLNVNSTSSDAKYSNGGASNGRLNDDLAIDTTSGHLVDQYVSSPTTAEHAILTKEELAKRGRKLQLLSLLCDNNSKFDVSYHTEKQHKVGVNCHRYIF